jgi:hypothetical protein
LLVWNSFVWMRPILHGMFWFTDWITLSCEVLCAAVEVAAGLLHCEVSELMTALSTRKIRAGGDDILQRLTYEQAIDSRDALAKAIYASLFDWLVDRINKSLEVGKRRSGRTISILDIYGFESFKVEMIDFSCASMVFCEPQNVTTLCSLCHE